MEPTFLPTNFMNSARIMASSSVLLWFRTPKPMGKWKGSMVESATTLKNVSQTQLEFGLNSFHRYFGFCGLRRIDQHNIPPSSLCTEPKLFCMPTFVSKHRGSLHIMKRLLFKHYRTLSTSLMKFGILLWLEHPYTNMQYETITVEEFALEALS
jgi:hypothetical protein